MNFDPANPTYSTAPYVHPHHSSLAPLDGNGDLLPPQQPSAASLDDLEEDFFGEYYFARYPDEVDPELSLGWIEWRPPLPTKLAMPSTFAEAELESIAPRNPRPADEPSLSEYFVKERVGESLLSVRQTASWHEVKDDSIYRIFPAVCEQVVTRRELRAKYRNRPDPRWIATRPANEVPGQSRRLKRKSSADAETIDSHHSPSTYNNREGSAEQGDILGNLEAALHASNGSHETHATFSSAHSRAGSVSSAAGEKITRPKALAPIRDHAQDDILAALGVTGSPKMVYQTPGPAVAPAPASHHQDGDLITRKPTSAAGPYGPRHAPPPPLAPYQQHKRLQSEDGNRPRRPSSASSHHTATGSDFEPEDMDCLLYTSPSPRDGLLSRMPSSA